MAENKVRHCRQRISRTVRARSTDDLSSVPPNRKRPFSGPLTPMLSQTWRSFSGPYTSIPSSYWSYGLVHQFPLSRTDQQELIPTLCSLYIHRSSHARAFCLPPACSLVCWTILRPWRCRQYVPPKRRVPLNALHGVISQKKILFKTTAVKTSNPWVCTFGAVCYSSVITYTLHETQVEVKRFLKKVSQ
jgi:hypothetical protein